jgi:hypothetical protein
MNGKQINEADTHSILLLIMIPLAFYLVKWGLKLLGVRFQSYYDATNASLSKEMQNALPFIYNDTNLIKDFANILKQEGDLDVLFKKIDKANQENWKSDWKSDGPGVWDWNSITFVKNHKFQPDAKRVASTLVKTNSYKIFSKKYSLSKEDDDMMENLFYWIVTRPNFEKEVDKYILNVEDASISEKSIQLKDLLPPDL